MMPMPGNTGSARCVPPPCVAGLQTIGQRDGAICGWSSAIKCKRFGNQYDRYAKKPYGRFTVMNMVRS